MFSSQVYSVPLLICFVLSPISLPSASAQTEVTCISNYAELKQSLLENGTGNMERLLYAFTQPNLPLPHYIWVYYFHNQSSEWSDILTCPPSQALHRCPIDSEDRTEDDSQYHVVFWADSPMLINLDIPLLKILSYNSILQYLGSGTCVQLVIPSFCKSVDPDTEREMIKFATSYLQSYSTSSQESERDYVLHCDEKFVTEFVYDAFLLGSEIIVCIGSGLLFLFFSLQLCSIKRSREEDGDEGNTQKFDMPLHEDKQKAKCQPSSVDMQTSLDRRSSSHQRSSVSRSSSKEMLMKNTDKRSLRDLLQMCKKGDRLEVDTTFEKNKTYLSVVMIINTTAISFLITDLVQFSADTEILKEALWYGYGTINIILFGSACVTILLQIPVFSTNLIIFSIVKCFPDFSCCRRTRPQQLKRLTFTVILGNVLSLVSFVYVLSRSFLIALAIATYPFDVGFILLGIGSGFVALMFVMWIAVHIAVDSYNAELKLFSTIISLVPYGSLLIILTGFLLSYIFVILRLNIRLGDPVTSLVTALVPTAVGFVAASRYKSELKKINSVDSNNEGRVTKVDLEGKLPSDMSMSSPAATQVTPVVQSSSEQPRPPAEHTTDIALHPMNKSIQASVQLEVVKSKP